VFLSNMAKLSEPIPLEMERYVGVRDCFVHVILN